MNRRIIEIITAPRARPSHLNFWPHALTTVAAIAAITLVTIFAFSQHLEVTIATAIITALVALGGASYGRFRR